MPRVFRKAVAHGIDHMCKGIQPDYIRSTEGCALGTADKGSGQGINQVKAEIKFSAVVHGGEHGEHAYPVRDEVGRVLGADYALAKIGDEECFEII